MFGHLFDVAGKVARSGRFLFVHIIGDFNYDNQKRRFTNQLVGLPADFEEELFGLEALWVRSRLISIFGVNQPTGHCMQTILNFQIGAVDAEDSELNFIPVLVSDTIEGVIGDYGYDGEPSLMFPGEVDEATRIAVTNEFVALLLSEPQCFGIFHDYLACEYDGSVEVVGCDGHKLHREFLGYLFPAHPSERGDEMLEGWWPFELPRAKRRPNQAIKSGRRSRRFS